MLTLADADSQLLSSSVSFSNDESEGLNL